MTSENVPLGWVGGCARTVAAVTTTAVTVDTDPPSRPLLFGVSLDEMNRAKG
jgi:hypothetical protein